MCILKDYLMILIFPCHTMSYFDPSVFNRSRVRQIYANLLIMSQIYEIQLHKINIYSHMFIQNIYDNEFTQNNTTMSPNCESLYSLFFYFSLRGYFLSGLYIVMNFPLILSAQPFQEPALTFLTKAYIMCQIPVQTQQNGIHLSTESFCLVRQFPLSLLRIMCSFF